MFSASEIIHIYISFFAAHGHKKISGASLVPQNDPTTLFTSSGMQPLVPYLLGEVHPDGTRLVDVQNCFRAQDIEEIGDNRHTTFFRMLGNWSLGDYFKDEQLPWFFEFLTDKETGLGLDPHKLHFTIFEGYKEFKKDEESYTLLTTLLKEKTSITNVDDHIHYYGAEKNWWSRAGNPDQMPAGEIGGPTSEVFYDFGAELHTHENSAFKNEPCHPNCDCGRYVEIGNSVFMTYKKESDGSFSPLPNKNVDFGGGLERLLAAASHQPDVFRTNLLQPIVTSIVSSTQKPYEGNERAIRIITDHFTAAVFITANGIKPSNKEQGYVLRRLLRRGLDNFYSLGGEDIFPIIEAIVEQYKPTDAYLVDQYEEIKNTILEEEQKYHATRKQATQYIEKKYKSNVIASEAKQSTPTSKIAASSSTPRNDENALHDGEVKEISAEDAFILYTTHGLSPTQIKSLGYHFNDQEFAEKMEAHQSLSRKGAEHKFKGGLADHEEKTVMGHTATHLMHQALRDVLGNNVHQTGSNITTERVRFDFNYDKRLTDEEIKKVEAIVNEKIKENLPVHFEIMPLEDAKKLGAIGLFMDTYGDKVKIYFIGPTESSSTKEAKRLHGEVLDSPSADGSLEQESKAYSVEFCGGPHVDFTGQLKSFKIIKQENPGASQKRLYARVDL